MMGNLPDVAMNLNRLLLKLNLVNHPSDSKSHRLHNDIVQFIFYWFEVYST